MTRLQPRRLRFAVVAVVLVLIVAYSWFSTSEKLTWQLPAGEKAQEKSPAPPLGQVTPTSSKGSTPTILEELSRPSITESSQWQDDEVTQSEPSIDTPAFVTPEDIKKAGEVLHTASSSSPRPASTSVSPSPKTCIPYETLQQRKQAPLSEGTRQFPYSRPEPGCRTFDLPAMEEKIETMRGLIKDPDLFRLFENSYPNTLDTMIKWRGYAERIDPLTGNKTTTDEELTYVITGDIDAMWLRDSASQIYSYLPLLEASTDSDSLASLWRGLINIHARYIIISPYCHSFQPPPESGIHPTHNGAYSQNHPNPPYDPIKVFDCKWELDSLASFLQVSVAYYQRTKDVDFFQKYNWIEAVEAAIDAAGAMRLGTYAKNGEVEHSAWTFTGWTNRGSETLYNDGIGNPTKENGMVRTAFRPSDDACIYQLLVPANMMWAKYLEEASFIMSELDGATAKNLTTAMRDFAFGVRKGIDRDAIVHHREFGDIFAYEIDGYGGANLMDDANIPSLLAMPLWNYSESAFPLPPPPKDEKPRDYAKIYTNTRNFVLSEANPYFMRGPVISAVGGPHIGPGKAWPMAAIVRGLTAFLTESTEDDGSASTEREVVKAREKEVKEQVMMVLNSTDGAGVIHESINSWNVHDWTRSWFGWANGLFGELILRMAEEDVAWLKGSWQDEVVEM